MGQSTKSASRLSNSKTLNLAVGGSCLGHILAFWFQVLNLEDGGPTSAPSNWTQCDACYLLK